MAETMQEAWKRIIGTEFNSARTECLYFRIGWNAKDSRA